jgi:hypothetical protein
MISPYILYCMYFLSMMLNITVHCWGGGDVSLYIFLFSVSFDKNLYLLLCEFHAMRPKVIDGWPNTAARLAGWRRVTRQV